MKTRGLVCGTKRMPSLPPRDNVPTPSISTEPPRSRVSRRRRAIRRVSAALEVDSLTGWPFVRLELSRAGRRVAGCLQNGTRAWVQARKCRGRVRARFVRAGPDEEPRPGCHPVDPPRRPWRCRILWLNVLLTALSSSPDYAMD